MVRRFAVQAVGAAVCGAFLASRPSAASRNCARHHLAWRPSGIEDWRHFPWRNVHNVDDPLARYLPEPRGAFPWAERPMQYWHPDIRRRRSVP